MKGEKLSSNDFFTILKLSISHPNLISRASFYGKLVKHLSSSNIASEPYGWKEPNAHLYLSQLLDYFPSLKYIHVIRHGLDMAFSKNLQQLKNWGFKYDINVNDNLTAKDISSYQLDYWIKTTQEIIDYKKRFNARIYLLNHSKLCSNPEEEISDICSFLNISPSKNLMEDLFAIPENKGTNNRFKNNDIDHFTEEQFSFVEKMGFNI
jgi:hypothetical protein